MIHPTLTGKKVVICEDQALVLAMIVHTAKQLGLSVVGTASDGRQAVDLTLQKQPDVVLMDGRMPKLSGTEATREILAQYPVCVVMLTAYGDLREEAMAAGASGFLLQPVTVRKLEAEIVRALEEFDTRGTS